MQKFWGRRRGRKAVADGLGTHILFGENIIKVKFFCVDL